MGLDFFPELPIFRFVDKNGPILGAHPNLREWKKKNTILIIILKWQYRQDNKLTKKSLQNNTNRQVHIQLQNILNEEVIFKKPQKKCTNQLTLSPTHSIMLTPRHSTWIVSLYFAVFLSHTTICPERRQPAQIFWKCRKIKVKMQF